MIIQHNPAAMNALRNRGRASAKSNKALERLSSGYKINRAADDAAGLAISEKMRLSVTGLGRAMENSREGIDLVKIAEGSMAELHSMLDRMITLADQSMNGTYVGADRLALDREYQQLLREIDRIAESASYSDIKLLDGSNRRLSPEDISMLLEQGAEGEKGSLMAIDRFSTVVDVASRRSRAEVEALKAKARQAGVRSAAAQAETPKAEAPEAPEAPAPPTNAEALPAADTSGKITISSDGIYDISNVAEGTMIEIQDDRNVKLTQAEGSAALKNISIVCKGTADLHIENLNIDCTKNQNIIDFQGKGSTLNLSGANTLTSPKYDAANAIRIEKALIHVGEYAELTVFGENASLNAAAENEGPPTDSSTGFYGAVLGSNRGKKCGDITIVSGNLTLKNNGGGAALGCGEKGDIGKIVIQGGSLTVDACGTYSYGIGNTGYWKSSGSILITGGVVTAESGKPPTSASLTGLGTAIGGNNVSITITGSSEVRATTHGTGAAIGGSPGGRISIQGGAVHAVTNGEGAAIGGRDRGTCGTIEISGGRVEASSTTSSFGAAIGNGRDVIPYGTPPTKGSIKISGTAEVIATNSSFGAAIGDGGCWSTINGTLEQSARQYAPNIEVSGGRVTVESAAGACGAAIGGGGGCYRSKNAFPPSTGSQLTVSGGSVTVKSGWIGGGADRHNNYVDSWGGPTCDFAPDSLDGTPVISWTGGTLNYEDPRSETRIPHEKNPWNHPAEVPPNTPDPPVKPDPPDPPVDPDPPQPPDEPDPPVPPEDPDPPKPPADPDPPVPPDEPDPPAPPPPEEPLKGGLILQIGESAEEYDRMRVYIEDMHALAMGVAGTDILTQENASRALAACRSAVDYVSAARADMGAYQNRLEHTVSTLGVSLENVTQSESAIRDADMAREILEYTKGSILGQSAQAMLAQASRQPEEALRLLS